jgi:hypothetical protein
MELSTIADLFEQMTVVPRSKSINFEVFKMEDIRVTVYIPQHMNVFYIDLFPGGETLFHEQVKNIEQLTHVLNVVFPTLKFSKLKGIFMSPHATDSRYKPSPSYHHLLTHPTLVLKSVQCVACMEDTEVKTDCNHPLCIQCNQNLKKRNCPMCRRCMNCDGDCDCNDEE